MSCILTEDLLYLVFLQSLPSRFSFTTESSSKLWTDPLPPPFNYSLVCRSWRKLVLSRPKLWCDIYIFSKFDVFEDYRNPAIERIIKKWLALSYPAPLRIILIVEEDPLLFIPCALLPLFLDEIHRWDLAIMEMNFPSPLPPSTITLHCLPPHNSLSLSLPSERLPAGCIDLSLCIGDTVSGLEQLHVGLGTCVRLPPHRDTLSLPRLRVLHYRSTMGLGNLDDLHCILSACPNLEDLEINIPGQAISTLASTREPIHLPRLSKLALIMSNRFTTDYLLDNFTCPSLRLFRFVIYYPLKIEPWEECASMEPLRIRDLLNCSCSNPPLEDMTLIWRESEPPVSPDLAESLESLLLSLKKLKTLRLHDYIFNHKVVEMLTVPGEGSSGSRLCPSLLNLHMAKGLDCVSDLTEDVLEDMLVSRWKAGSVRSVSFAFPRFWEFHGSMRVRDCIKEGLIAVNDSFRYGE
ncbi:hypothetical protein SCHPADRAFT_925790 [Schizopora paradoxa]|uniref:F-box domain-containing protein n=1 Tax=Schizopora paradoxa TaxID=27342 RepID=A0A0H2S0S9_9AGAM|nr:hypothetical protein SCHPADRAFT_925790 [Schizopora paradoxa]